jgi:hypothetical protein
LVCSHDPKCSRRAHRVRFAPDSGRIAASQRTAGLGQTQTSHYRRAPVTGHAAVNVLVFSNFSEGLILF